MSCKPLGPFKGFTMLSMSGTTLVTGCSEKEAGSSSPWALAVKPESKNKGKMTIKQPPQRATQEKEEGGWTDLVPQMLQTHGADSDILGQCLMFPDGEPLQTKSC